MNLAKRRLLGGLGRAASSARRVSLALGAPPPDELRVLLHHDVPRAMRDAFRTQLAHLSRSWRFVTPNEFAEIMEGRVPLRGRALLLSFDDGFASNREVAEEVLGPLGISALFFLVTDFVECADRARARRFIAERIQPGADEAAMDPGLANMHWGDVEWLVASGHSVGAHTATHARLSAVGDEVTLAREIVGSARRIEDRLGVRVEHFAFPFGNLESFSPAALAMSASRFRFVHSGLRGSNMRSARAAVRRDALAADDAPSVADAFLEGLVDWRYAASRTTLDRWAERADEAGR